MHKILYTALAVSTAFNFEQGSLAAGQLQNFGSKHLYTRLACLEHFVHCSKSCTIRDKRHMTDQQIYILGRSNFLMNGMDYVLLI